MKFTKFIKTYKIEILFIALIIACFYIYFVVYFTPSKHAWYDEIYHQFNVVIYEVTNLGR